MPAGERQFLQGCSSRWHYTYADTESIKWTQNWESTSSWEGKVRRTMKRVWCEKMGKWIWLNTLPAYTNFKHFKRTELKIKEARKIAPQLRALVAFEEEPGSVPSTHVVNDNHLYLQFWGTWHLLWFMQAPGTHVGTHTYRHSYIHMK